MIFSCCPRARGGGGRVHPRLTPGSPQAEAAWEPFRLKVLQWARDSDGILPARRKSAGRSSSIAAAGSGTFSDAGRPGAGGGVLWEAIVQLLLPSFWRLSWLLGRVGDGSARQEPAQYVSAAEENAADRVAWAKLKGSGRAFEKVRIDGAGQRRGFS